MEYNLKDKIAVTKDFLNDLEIRSWQEIEHLQNQITNIEITPDTIELVKLLKSLLTSYYVFTGGLENLTNTNATYKIPEFTDKVCVEKETAVTIPTEKVELSQDTDIFEPHNSIDDTEQIDSEPFEYFVDFDEPSGDPISDEDLYGH